MLIFPTIFPTVHVTNLIINLMIRCHILLCNMRTTFSLSHYPTTVPHWSLPEPRAPRVIESLNNELYHDNQITIGNHFTTTTASETSDAVTAATPLPPPLLLPLLLRLSTTARRSSSCLVLALQIGVSPRITSLYCHYWSDPLRLFIRRRSSRSSMAITQSEKRR
jgi:hypothetical protein